MNSAPPPLPAGTTPRKKPSALASCILLGLILGVVGALGSGGWWAYRTFIAQSPTAPTAPVTPPAAPAPAPTTTPTVASTTPAKPSLVEKPSAPAPALDPLASPVEPAIDTPPPTTAATEPAAEPTTVVTEPADATAVTPNAEPPTPSPVVAAEPSPDNPTDPLPEPTEFPAPADPNPVMATEQIQSYAEDAPQVTALKADADRRIDEAPAEVYSDSDKQRVRDAIRQAKRLTKVATLRFGTGTTGLGSNERTRLKKALLTSEAEALLSDPQAVLFILGFADATGTSEVNRSISQKRAAGVGEVLKGFKVPNNSYAVGIGATTLLSSERQSKNRAVEVWIVQP